MYKEGLNLGVTCSVFDETPELRQRFGTHESRVVFKTLNPNFDFEHEYRIKMDTKIFDHLKYRFAVFEVRHYFVNEEDGLLDLGRREETKSEATSEFQTDKRDYITLGYAKVQLSHLIMKAYGIDQSVAVLDQFSQKLGYLNLKLSLNYQSKKHLRLQKEPAEHQIEGKYFLALSFVELISQNNKYLLTSANEIKHLIFKFKLNEDHHQVRYIPSEASTVEFPLNIKVFEIHKMIFLDFEINEETFEKSSTPVEIQIWTKIENKTRCMKDREELIGSAFLDLQSLIGNRTNLRLRNEATNVINSHDGYFTLLQNEKN